MWRGIQITLGFVIGTVGILHFADNPTLGGSTLLLSGFMILDGIDFTS
jgi:hypothetical protein